MIVDFGIIQGRVPLSSRTRVFIRTSIALLVSRRPLIFYVTCSVLTLTLLTYLASKERRLKQKCYDIYMSQSALAEWIYESRVALP